MVKKKMEKNTERRWRSKVSEGLRVKVPKDIAEIYGMKKDDIVEWIYDEKGKVRMEVKEMVLREKKAKAEKVKVEDVVRKTVIKANDKKYNY